MSARKPTAFRLNDPRVTVATADDEARAAPGVVRVTPEPEHFDLPVPVAPPEPPRKRFPWGAIFWSALGGLVSLGAGLAATRLIEDLYARAGALDWWPRVPAPAVVIHGA